MPCKDAPSKHQQALSKHRARQTKDRGEQRDGQQGGSRTARAFGVREAHQPDVFYRQVVAELRKVVWPTRDQLVTYFIVVMVFVLIMMAIVSLLDLGLGKLAFEIFDGRSAE